MTRRFILHNLVAHPLLVMCPPLGEWLHDRTIPDDPAAVSGSPTSSENDR